MIMKKILLINFIMLFISSAYCAIFEISTHQVNNKKTKKITLKENVNKEIDVLSPWQCIASSSNQSLKLSCTDKSDKNLLFTTILDCPFKGKSQARSLAYHNGKATEITLICNNSKPKTKHGK